MSFAADAVLTAAPPPTLAATTRNAEVLVEFAPRGMGNPDRDLTPAPEMAGQVRRLSRFVVEEARPRLATGDVLSVRFDEVVLAGSLEPWRSPRLDGVRVISPAYPPRIALWFRWVDANGNVAREGERRLTNLDFQRDPRAASSNDTLRYERALLDEWIDREFAAR